jgi:hypothetical protein
MRGVALLIFNHFTKIQLFLLSNFFPESVWKFKKVKKKSSLFGKSRKDLENYC